MLKLRHSYWSGVLQQFHFYLKLYLLPIQDVCFLGVSWIVFWNGYVHTERDRCLQAPEGSWPVPPLQDCLNCPRRHMHFSAGYKGTWIFSCLKASQKNLSLPAHPLLDAADISLLWSQLHQSVPMPSDTEGDWRLSVWVFLLVRR